MRIIYIANARIPTEKAHGIQIMKMCESFASGNELELVLPRRLNKIKKDPFLYYGMDETFKITKLPCIDLIPFSGHFGNLGLWIESVTFFFPAFFYAIFKKADLIYTRNKFILPFALFRKNFLFEAHAFPNNYFLYSFFLKRLKGVVVITDKLKSLFLGKGILDSRILTAPDGVDIAMFAVNCSQSEARQKLGLKQGGKIVLYTGHLYKWKGVGVLIAAAGFLPENVTVYLVGGMEKDLANLDCRLPNVKIIGHRPYAEIPFWLKAADVLCLPNSGKEEISRSWTSPLKAFEYMASNRPIVASNLPSIGEILNGENAILVEPDNPNDLARGIKKALEDEDLALKVAAQAFLEVQNYIWQKRVQKIYEYFSVGKK
ncbi:MAG: glycosyltransferase family 4 protein [Candidatus Nealsonbacteria bacterium]